MRTADLPTKCGNRLRDEKCRPADVEIGNHMRSADLSTWAGALVQWLTQRVFLAGAVAPLFRKLGFYPDK